MEAGQGKPPAGAATSQSSDGVGPPQSPVTPPRTGSGTGPSPAPSGAATPPLTGPGAHPVEAVFMAELQQMKRTIERVDARVMAINLLLGASLALAIYFYSKRGGVDVAAS